jgi:hypothetical protein
MRDRLTERALTPRPLGIDVDPLAVAGTVGELLDHRLIDDDPRRDADLLADHLLQLLVGRRSLGHAIPAYSVFSVNLVLPTQLGKLGRH